MPDIHEPFYCIIAMWKLDIFPYGAELDLQPSMPGGTWPEELSECRSGLTVWGEEPS
jgi:hypothetical protein